MTSAQIHYSLLPTDLFNQLVHYHAASETVAHISLHPLLFLHPLSQWYPSLNRRKFLKKLMRDLEDSPHTPHAYYLDQLYELSLAEMTQKPSPNRWGFRIFWIREEHIHMQKEEMMPASPEDLCANTLRREDPHQFHLAHHNSSSVYIPLICRVGEQFRNVGLSVWEAQFLLLECLQCIPLVGKERSNQLFGNASRRLRILELGCGAGLTGVYVQRMARTFAKHVDQLYLTDYQHCILDNVAQNLQVNSEPSLHSGNEHEESSPQVSTKLLDWTQYDAQELKDLKCNLILAADVVYDVSVIEPLSTLLKELFETANDESPPVCYFFITKRRESTFEYFQQSLQKENLQSVEYTKQFLHEINQQEGLFASQDMLYDRESVRVFRIQPTHG